MEEKEETQRRARGGTAGNSRSRSHCSFLLVLPHPPTMANSTRRTAQQIHGTNPQFLIEKVIRSRIYDSLYWKEHCFALTAETLVDRSLELDAVGGTYGVQKPCQFLCLVLKLLQIQPEKEILLVYLEAKEFK